MTRDANHIRRKTVLHVIDALNYGGAQNLLVQLAKWTPADRYRTLVCVFQPQLDMRAHIEAQGVPVYAFNRPRPSILRPHRLFAYIYRNIRDILTICRQEAVDLLHCHLSDAELFGLPAGRLAGGVRLVSTVHYPDLLPARGRRDPRNFLRICITRRIYRWTDVVIAVSDDVACQLQRTFELPPKKLRVVINGIDTEAFAPPPASTDSEGLGGDGPRRITVLSVGRLMPPKGHIHLVDAVARLTAAYPSIRLLLAGDGDLRPMLEKRSRQMGLDDHVQFLGSRPDVAHLLADADIFVLPSLWEGTSLALLEAMAAAKPIVCTDIPGNLGLMRHLDNCYLALPADPSSLADGIAHFIRHPQTAKQCAENARSQVTAKYDIRQTVSALARIWG